jgi:L-rhamnose mutarotase
MKKYAMTLDLKNDPVLIAQYEEYHKNIWPEIVNSIRGAGIVQMEIYRYETRLTMIMEAEDSFSFEVKAAHDAVNEKVQEWEFLMWNYQQKLPLAKEGEKWVEMKKIFDLQNI